MQYLSKRKTGYNWIVTRPKGPERQEVKVFVWWASKAAFFATTLRTQLRRLSRKSCTECLEVSKAVKTKSILKKLAESTKTHGWDGGYVGNELMEYLKVGFSELRESLKRIKTTERERDDPLPPPPPSSPVKISPNERNDLLLKLLMRTTFNLKLLMRATFNVAGVCKSVTGVSDELKILSQAFCDEMTNVNSKVDKLSEQLYHKLYDPMFDGDCKCEKCN